MALIHIQDDARYIPVRRAGRFSIEREAAGSPAHLEAAVAEMQERMIAGLASKGYAYVDHGFGLEGPLPHLEFAEDARADPGPGARPDPRDLAAWARFERAERARVARKLDEEMELVDYVLTATFVRRAVRTFHLAKEDPWR